MNRARLKSKTTLKGSAFADMLHDTERNQKYDIALQDAIKLMHERGRPAHVLDIGTGTGLLSMMAVRAGADTVTACEAFKPMAQCAKQVITENGCRDKIRLIQKRSTEITVGPEGDMARRANILVTEVFDTELIGEGAIGTFNHAHKYLLEEDCIVVPHVANMYVQVVQSEFALRHHKFQPISIADCADIVPPLEVSECLGTPSVHDVQMSELTDEQFQPITEPVQVYRFELGSKTPMVNDDHSIQEVTAVSNGRCHAVFMWWDLEMDTRGQCILSCAPKWAHPEPEKLQWRDHWMQAIYYPKHTVEVLKGDTVSIHSCHDEYSLWFDVLNTNNNKEHVPMAPVCTCGGHVACSRSRLAMLHDPERNQAYQQALKGVVDENTVCLCISDGSLLPLMVARMGAKKVYMVEQGQMSKRMLQSYIHANDLYDKVKILARPTDDLQPPDLDNHKITLLLAEPYFFSSLLPWHNIHFWYSRTQLSSQLADNAQVLPCCATMKAVAVEFKDLWKIRAPVGVCEGFNLNVFDQLIEKSSSKADAMVEPQPLWEYPSVALTEIFGLMTFDFTRPLTGVRTVERDGSFFFQAPGKCNGIAIWLDYQLDKTGVVKSGLLKAAEPGQQLHWDPYSRQGVHLFKIPHDVDEAKKLKFRAVFKPQTGDFKFDFKIS